MRSARPLVVWVLAFAFAFTTAAPARAATPAASALLASSLAAEGAIIASLTARVMTLVSGALPASTPLPAAWQGGPPVRDFGGAPALAAQALAVRATGSRVELRWSVPPAIGALTVYRRGNRGGWEPVARVQAGGDGEVAHVDTAVVAGQRYAYCLGAGSGGGEAFGGESRAEVPGDFALSVRGLRRAADATEVAFSLPEDAHARVAVIDGSGRRLWEHDFVPASAGEQVVRVHPSVRLAAGTYRVTLAQGPRLAMARVTLTD